MDKIRVIVTGGSGFLGQYIISELVASGYEVIALCRSYKKIFKELGVRHYPFDLKERKPLDESLKGVQSIFHVASLTGIWGDYDEYFQVNVLGTQHLLAESLRLNISQFIYTGSPSVVLGKDDLLGPDEGLNYLKNSDYLSAYQLTKKLAEEAVIKAHQKGRLQTISLRPHLIWGPNDPHLLPRLLERSKKNRLKIVGDGKNKVDVIYVKNAAYAQRLALEYLMKSPNNGGEVYFLGQEKPVNLWDFINSLLELNNRPAITQKISSAFSYKMGFVLEKCYRGAFGFNKEPPMTRFLALSLSKSHYFSHEKAARELGYKPLITIDEGLKELKKHL